MLLEEMIFEATVKGTKDDETYPLLGKKKLNTKENTRKVKLMIKCVQFV